MEMFRPAYATLLNAYVEAEKVEDAEGLVRLMDTEGLTPDTRIYNMLLKAHAKAGDVDAALGVVVDMTDGDVDVSVITYNSLIRAHFKGGDAAGGHAVFGQMKSAGAAVAPDRATYNTILAGYHAKRGDVAGAQGTLCEMDAAGIERDVYTYNALVNTYLAAGDIPGGWRLLEDMEASGMSPSHAAYRQLFKALEKAEGAPSVARTEGRETGAGGVGYDGVKGS